MHTDTFSLLFVYYAKNELGGNSNVLSFLVESYNPTFNRFSIPVNVVLFAAIYSPVPVEYTVNAPLTADETDYSEYCTRTNPEIGTFHDLSLDPTPYEQTFQAVLDTVKQKIPGMTITDTNSITWTPNLFQHHTEKGVGINRVCYGNLPQGNPPRNQLYEGNLNVDAVACIPVINGSVYVQLPPEIVSGSLSQSYGVNQDQICIVVNICNLTVARDRVVEFIESGVDCNVSPSQIITTYTLISGTNPPCDQSKAQVACKGDSIVFGTNISLSPLAYNMKYQWVADTRLQSQNTLSSYTIAQPLWKYNFNNDVAAGSILKYYCIVTYNEGVGRLMQTKKFNYCEFVYLCGTCNSASGINHLEKHQTESINEQKLEFSIIPNPAIDKISISNFVNIKENCVIAILDGLGRIIEKQPKGVLRNDFKIENLANGIYYIAVLENGNTLSTKRFIKQP